MIIIRIASISMFEKKLKLFSPRLRNHGVCVCRPEQKNNIFMIFCVSYTFGVWKMNTATHQPCRCFCSFRPCHWFSNRTKTNTHNELNLKHKNFLILISRRRRFVYMLQTTGRVRWVARMPRMNESRRKNCWNYIVALTQTHIHEGPCAQREREGEIQRMLMLTMPM